MNLKPPPVFLRIPSITQSIHSVRPHNVVCLVDRVKPEIETEVHHLVGDRRMSFITSLTSQEIEKAVGDLIAQQEEYSERYFNIKFSGDDE
jgi:hypothetical protein